MSVLDDLKSRSRAQNAGATGEKPNLPQPDEGPPAATRRPPAESYCAYWIARLEAVRSHPREAIERAVREAIRQAPARRRPPVEDGRLLVLAGGALSVQDLVDWLRVRSALDARAGERESALPADTARHWLRRLEGAASTVGWGARCREVARDAVRVGHGLEPHLVEALIAQPQAACGYLRAAGTKGQFRDADARSARLSGGPDPAPAESGVTPSGEAGPENLESPVTPPAAPLGPPPFAPPAPVGVSGHGVGLRLGGLAGGVLGGVAAGLKAGFSRAARAVPASGSSASSPLSDRPVPGAPEADAALAAFGDAAARLGHHPKLAAFWEAVDREAGTRFQGRRAGVFREMCDRPQHPLRRWFERVRDREPEVALWFGQSQAAFAKLETAWMSCAARPSSAARWAPSSAQLEALRAACQQVPPDRERPPLVERAEQLLKALSAAVRQAFERFGRRPSPSASPAPSP